MKLVFKKAGRYAVGAGKQDFIVSEQDIGKAIEVPSVLVEILLAHKIARKHTARTTSKAV